MKNLIINIPRCICAAVLLVVFVCVFLGIGLWETFDEHVLGTKYEKMSDHYRSY